MSQNLLNVSDLTAELEFANRVAREAATIVNTFYVGSSEVSSKSDQSPVTEADRSANQHIVSRVCAAFPDDGVLSEESKDDFSRLEKERVWIIDPLDGTKEFIARNGEFSIMIGLAIEQFQQVRTGLQPGTQPVTKLDGSRQIHLPEKHRGNCLGRTVGSHDDPTWQPVGKAEHPMLAAAFVRAHG